MTFELPELPYAYDALEPHFDEETMKLHHDKHHQTYVNNANKALKGTDWADKKPEEILKAFADLPEELKTPVRNNVGGHANHSLFWTILSPNGGGEPEGKLAEAIKDAFGSFEAFQEKFTAAAKGRFGSGWAWLVVDDGKLKIMDTPNQDTPLMEGLIPILGLDVWEHAYYLKYKNVRPDYIAAFFKIVNWEEVARRFEEAI